MPMKALPLPPKGWHGIKSNNAARQMAALGRNKSVAYFAASPAVRIVYAATAQLGTACVCVWVGDREQQG